MRNDPPASRRARFSFKAMGSTVRMNFTYPMRRVASVGFISPLSINCRRFFRES